MSANPDVRAAEPPAAPEPEWDLAIEDDPTEEARYPEATGALMGAVGAVLAYLDKKGGKA